jgi:hypothetical protein
MKQLGCRWSGAVVFVALIAFLRGTQPFANGVAAWSVTTESRGTHTFTIPIKAWGRYSLQAASEHPVAVGVADRRSGTIGRDGEIGHRNGRVDLFLDKGEYRVTVLGEKKTNGPVTVSAMPFAYIPGLKPSYLVPLKENRFSLEDLQQAGFWFEIPSDTMIYISACGRNLADLRLWRDGEWLVETDNRPFTARPRPETPLAGITLVARVPKGTYLVTCYGGPETPWAIESKEHPLSLTWGLESLAGNGIIHAAIPSRGYYQVLLAPGTSTVVVEAPDKKRLIAEVNGLTSDYSDNGWVAGDSIFAKLSAPRIALAVGTGSGMRQITVRGAPGQPFTLQTMSAPVDYLAADTVPTSYWVATLHTGNYLDQIGASGFIVDQSGAIVSLRTDTLGSDRELAKRFNLLESESMYVWVKEQGNYSITPGGTGFSWRFVRYFYNGFPADYKMPDFISGAGNVDLLPGIYRMEINPLKKGVATMVIRKSSLIGSIFSVGKALIGKTGDDNRAWNPPSPGFQFTNVMVPPRNSYTIVRNEQHPELSTIAPRRLPLNPDEPLGFWTAAGQTVQIPVKLSGKRLLTVRDARGAEVAFEIGGKRYDKGATLDGGAYSIVVAETGKEPRRLVLGAVPPERLPGAAPPSYPDEKIAALPKFPAIPPGSTAFLDIDRQSYRLYTIDVKEPGLYRIETTGRLKTKLTLRDRFANFKREAAYNGVGRNAAIIEYFLSGLYQLSVEAIDNSAGHLGVAVYRNPLQDGGALETDIDNRCFVPAFSGSGYDVKIPSGGLYRLESVGQSGNFPIRVEDKDGWPFEPTVSEAPLDLQLDKGTYRMFSLPTTQDGRRITRLTPMREAVRIRGKGPHRLLVNSTASSTWEEKKGKGPADTVPAVFTFDLPAPIAATLTISAGFTAKIYKEGNDSALIAWSGAKKVDLAMGSYRIAVRPTKKSNYAPYQLSVSTIDLIPGLSYELSRWKILGVNVGAAGVVELGSQGTLDVTAQLLDNDGKTVLAANDDGYMDWNFSISRALKPGRYFLKVESAEGAFTATRVFMRALRDTLFDSLSTVKGVPRTVRCNLARHIGVFPLGKADTGDIISFAVKGASRLGCSIEKKNAAGDDWTPIAQDHGESPSLSLPRDKRAIYRFKVWSENNMAEEAAVSYACTDARLASWSQAASELTGSAPLVGSRGRAWYKLDLAAHAPGHFRVAASSNELSAVAVSTALDSALVDESASWFASSNKYAWVEFDFEREGRYRVVLDPMILEKEKPVVMNLIGSRPRAYELPADDKTLGLVIAETDGYHPLCAAAPRQGLPTFTVGGVAVDRGMWVGQGRSATAVLPGETRRVAVWNGIASIDGTDPSARLRYYPLSLSDEGVQNPGVSTWTAKKPGARVTHCPQGQGVRLRVTLPPGSAALVVRGDGVKLLEYVDADEPLVREFYTAGGDLYLLALKPDTRFDVATFTTGNMAAEALSLTDGGWEAKLTREGTLLIPLLVKGGGQRGLFYQGAVAAIGWVGPDGILRDNLTDGDRIGAEGFIVLRHGVGRIKMNLCAGVTPESVMACKWGAPPVPVQATAIKGSMQCTLGSKASWFALTVADSQHVNLSSPLPLAAILLRDGKPVNYQEAWERFNWDLPLAPGSYVLGVHPTAGSSLEGGELTALFRPIERLSEKQPFTGYFASGESRLLSFFVKAKSQFGIGLRMNSETVQARLFDIRGNTVAQGKQQFVTLEKGTYYLWLRVPAGAEGTQCTAYLFGQEPPPNEPPENIVRWIINGAEGQRPAVSNGSDDERQPAPTPSWRQTPTDEEMQQQPQQQEGGDGGQTGETQQPNEGSSPEGQNNESSQGSAGGTYEGN